MVEKKEEEKQHGKREKKLLKFAEWRERRFWAVLKKWFFFLKTLATCPLLSAAKGPTFFPLMWLHTQPQGGKIEPFWMLKSCLDLRATSLVPVPRVSLHPSGPVFESRQYIYQNAQYETLNVVQRLVLLNFKLHKTIIFRLINWGLIYNCPVMDYSSLISLTRVFFTQCTYLYQEYIYIYI